MSHIRRSGSYSEDWFIRNKIVLRLFTLVVLELVAFVLTGVDVLATEVFSGSESESWLFRWTNGANGFLFNGAMSFSISFWFSAIIFAKSDIISFLKDIFMSFKFSGCNLGNLLDLAMRFSGGLFSATEASKSPETSSATVFLY